MKLFFSILVMIPLWLPAQNQEAFRAFGFQMFSSELAIHSNLSPISIGEYSAGLSYRNLLNLRQFHFHISFGYAPEPRYGTLYKIEKTTYCDIGNGSFFKIGTDMDLLNRNLARKIDKIFRPALGLKIVGSRINEFVLDGAISSTGKNRTSMNYGAAVALSNVFYVKNRLQLRIGVQIGKDIVENRTYQKYSYTPGLGIYWDSMRTQLIGELSYVFKRWHHTARV